jgi:hypothetical protein
MALHASPGATGRLQAQDPDQPREIRRQAMFWLAHSDDDEGLAALEELLTR